jgi:hypothetical protein
MQRVKEEQFVAMRTRSCVIYELSSPILKNFQFLYLHQIETEYNKKCVLIVHQSRIHSGLERSTSSSASLQKPVIELRIAILHVLLSQCLLILGIWTLQLANHKPLVSLPNPVDAMPLSLESSQLCKSGRWELPVKRLCFALTDSTALCKWRWNCSLM